MSNRNKYYGLLQIGKKTLTMDEDTYRKFLQQHGAKNKGDRISASTMKLGELVAAVADMEKMGFKRTRKSAINVNNWRKPRLNKITALWCTLADAGVVRNRSEMAMHDFCSKQMKSDKLQWASAGDLNKCIEALKGMAKREGVNINA